MSTLSDGGKAQAYQLHLLYIDITGIFLLALLPRCSLAAAFCDLRLFYNIVMMVLVLRINRGWAVPLAPRAASGHNNIILVFLFTYNSSRALLWPAPAA